MRHQPFFSNQEASKYTFLEQVMHKLKDPDPQPFIEEVQKYYHDQLFNLEGCLKVCVNTCQQEHALLEPKLFDYPSKKIALYFIAAEFHARLSLLAIEQKEAEPAYAHYEQAMYVLSSAAEDFNEMKEQGHPVNDALLEKSNTYGLTCPIEMMNKVQMILSDPLDRLLEQHAKKSRPA